MLKLLKLCNKSTSKTLNNFNHPSISLLMVSFDFIIRKNKSEISDIIDTTASVVDLGSSVISQIRTLGQLDDNPERPQEILDASVKIESVMLR